MPRGSKAGRGFTPEVVQSLNAEVFGASGLGQSRPQDRYVAISREAIGLGLAGV